MSDFQSDYPGQKRLIAALRDPRRYPHAAASVELIETHISWVLLAGSYAYKIKKALNLGYDKAFSAIFDSNLTTFITGVILFQFGSGPVQGFALTLMIGIVVSMFSAIFISRVIFNVLTDKYGSNVSFG